jgi:hypothetical protein
VVPDNTTVKLSHRNQELYLIPVKFEHKGRYCCVANNGLTEAHMEGNLTVKGEFIIMNCCHGSRKICRGKQTHILELHKSKYFAHYSDIFFHIY